MERQIIFEMEAWKEQENRKPLVLLGARLVGKTWAMIEFGHKAFKSVAYIDCSKTQLVKFLFAQNFDARRALLQIQRISGVQAVPGETLIIFDEIQDVKRGLEYLRLIGEHAPEFHIMASGNLLEVALKKDKTLRPEMFDVLRMNPMNFGEFLCAVASDEFSERALTESIVEQGALAANLTEYLKQYYFVGGMPGVVNEFLEEGTPSAVRKAQRAILQTFRQDFERQTTKVAGKRLSQILDSLPAQLSRENKRFTYSTLGQGLHASTYKKAVDWLVASGIVHRVPQVKSLKAPLEAEVNKAAFKLFLLDCGLLSCLAGMNQAQTFESDSIFTENCSALSIQFVLQQSIACGFKHYYFAGSRASSEIDFIIEYENEIVPVEVQTSGNASAIRTYFRSHPEFGTKGVRFCAKPYKDHAWGEDVPIYTIGRFFGEIREGDLTVAEATTLEKSAG